MFYVLRLNYSIETKIKVLFQISHFNLSKKGNSILGTRTIHPTLSKVYERLLYNQMYPYFEQLFSKFQFGSRKGFNAEHCLITVIEKWRGSVDGSGQAGALLGDLSKAFDCNDHELLIAKLYVYGFDRNSLYFINSYLKRRKQRTKMNSSYNAFAEILFGVPQGSILGPLLLTLTSVTSF